MDWWDSYAILKSNLIQANYSKFHAGIFPSEILQLVKSDLFQFSNHFNLTRQVFFLPPPIYNNLRKSVVEESSYYLQYSPKLYIPSTVHKLRASHWLDTCQFSLFEQQQLWRRRGKKNFSTPIFIIILKPKIVISRVKKALAYFHIKKF